MKNRGILALLLSLFFLVVPSIFLQTADAATRKTIVLLDTPHRDLNGVFLDNQLTTSLLATGRLGKLVFSPVAEPRRWLIDAALLADVEALALTNIDAENWLLELKYISAADPVIAIPYGHPNISLAKRLAPTELLYYYNASKTRLETELGRPVAIVRSLGWGSKSEVVPPDTIQSYSVNRREIALMSTVVPPTELDSLRSKLAELLAPGQTRAQQLFFARNAYDAIANMKHKLRIVSGNYRLTSENEKVPVTLVNDFGIPITVNLQLIPLNPRIQIPTLKSIVLGAKSKTQILLPVKVLAPGLTTVLAQFVNSDNSIINDTAYLTLTGSVISPTVAWFTTGSAILLFLAALTQSVRRVRRSRK